MANTSTVRWEVPIKRRLVKMLIPLSIATAFSFLPVAQAEQQPECAGNVEIVVTVQGIYYVDVRSLGDVERNEIASVWFYRESNGVDGLQRGGTGAIIPETDPCDESDPGLGKGSDTLIT